MAQWPTKEGNNFWFFSVYAPMPASGDPVADFKAAWKRIVLSTGKYKDYPGWGSYSTYEMPKTAGYSGRYNGDDSVDKTHSPGSTGSRRARATSLC